MEWMQPIDAYCERAGSGLWAEPLNALSNAGFFLAAIYGAGLARRRHDGWLAMLAAVAAMVGLGSTLFHTIATRWASLADVIPIGIFIALGFGLVMRRRLRLPVWAAAGATAGFMALSPLVATVAEPLVGSSAGYVPALAALIAVGAGLAISGRAGGGVLVAAGLVFAVSLGLRIADQPMCAAWPVGTHAGWHLLNAVVLALVIRAAASTETSGPAPARR